MIVFTSRIEKKNEALQFDMRYKAIGQNFDWVRIFARHVQRCHIQYGTSAPKTVTQFFTVTV